jgi:hypothetical protein
MHPIFKLSSFVVLASLAVPSFAETPKCIAEASEFLAMGLSPMATHEQATPQYTKLNTCLAEALGLEPAGSVIVIVDENAPCDGGAACKIAEAWKKKDPNSTFLIIDPDLSKALLQDQVSAFQIEATAGGLRMIERPFSPKTIMVAPSQPLVDTFKPIVPRNLNNRLLRNPGLIRIAPGAN